MRKRLIWIAPAAILSLLIFTWIGGELVMHLWNWLAPQLFGLRPVSFWQALGLLALCRILFGGFGLSGGGSRRSRRRMRGRMCREMDEGWEAMRPEDRERFRQGLRDHGRRTTPLEPEPGA
jgi:hypothetical protein